MSRTRWRDTLPETTLGNSTPALVVLLHLVEALDAQGRGDTATMLEEAGQAAAEVRAWRKSLPERTERVASLVPDDAPDSALLLRAVSRVAFAAQAASDENTCLYLRIVEACLRDLWKRHQDVEPARPIMSASVTAPQDGPTVVVSDATPALKALCEHLGVLPKSDDGSLWPCCEHCGHLDDPQPHRTPCPSCDDQGDVEPEAERLARYRSAAVYRHGAEPMARIEAMGLDPDTVHSPIVCHARPCPIHRPTIHALADWSQQWDAGNRQVVRVCPHGSSGTDPDDRAIWGLSHHPARWVTDFRTGCTCFYSWRAASSDAWSGARFAVSKDDL